jgi:hypothetical protein
LEVSDQQTLLVATALESGKGTASKLLVVDTVRHCLVSQIWALRTRNLLCVAIVHGINCASFQIKQRTHEIRRLPSQPTVVVKLRMVSAVAPKAGTEESFGTIMRLEEIVGAAA